uniref:Uncharacterized protein n=1 Tax=viral metagenome TaxID=1070528 RepID=A0A6C0BY69_9ZZZZ
MKIGIIGNGFVGKATFILGCKDVEVIAYDKNPQCCIPLGTTLKDLNKCDIVFISVPTPMKKDGSCHLNIITSVLDELKQNNFKGTIVLRSTVPPGTSKELGCCFMPEFLTEKNFEQDFINNKKWIFGVDKSKYDEVQKNILGKVIELANTNNKIKHNTVEFMTTEEAEMVKMFRNVFLATKVSICNEFAQYCEKKEINYENVRRVATEDERIGEKHSKVPGHDGKKGFGGTCFPKDTSSMRNEMVNVGMKPYILDAVIERNNKMDRPLQDWKKDVGRATI